MSGLPFFAAIRLALCLALVCAACSFASGAGDETITVLRFQNCSEDESLNWLGLGVADMVLCMLRESGNFQVTERERLTDALAEQSFGASGFVDPATATQAGRTAKTDLALSGGYTVSNGTLDVSAFIVRTSDGKVAATAFWQGPRDSLLEAPKALLAQLLHVFGMSVSESDIARVTRYFPRKVDAARAYYQGVNEEVAGNPAGALRYYLVAESFTHAHPMLYERLGRLYFLLNEIKTAFFYTFHRTCFATIDQYEQAMKSLFDMARRAGKVNMPEMKMYFLKRCIEMGKTHEDKTGELAKLKTALPNVFSNAVERFRKRNEVRGTTDECYFVADAICYDPKVKKLVGWYDSPFVATKPPYRIQKDAEAGLAAEYEAKGQAEKALQIYADMMDDLKYLDDLQKELGDLRPTHFFDFSSCDILCNGNRTIVKHAEVTGQVIRHSKFLIPINTNDPVFTRDAISVVCQGIPAVGQSGWRVPFPNTPPGYTECYTFAAPSGMRFAGVVVQPIHIRGKLDFEIRNDTSSGSPSLGGFIHSLSFADKPERLGKDNLSAEDNTVEVSFGDASCPLLKVIVSADTTEYLSWRLYFRLAPVDFSEQRTFLTDAPQGVHDHYRDHIWSTLFTELVSPSGDWDDIYELYVTRGVTTVRGVHTHPPKSIVVGQHGHLFHIASLGGDIRIVRLDPPEETRYTIPNCINTEGLEESPRLFFFGNSTYQLIWRRHNTFEFELFTSFSSDLHNWTFPKRMIFSEGERSLPTEFASKFAQKIFRVHDGRLIAFGSNLELFESSDAVRWEVTSKKKSNMTLLDCDQDTSGRIWALLKSVDEDILLSYSDDALVWATPIQTPLTATSGLRGATITCLPAGRVGIIPDKAIDAVILTYHEAHGWETVKTGFRISGSISVAARNRIFFLLLGLSDKGYYLCRSRDMFNNICGAVERDDLKLEQTINDSGFDETQTPYALTGLLSLPFDSEGLPEELRPIAEVFAWHVSSKLADKAGLPLVDRNNLSKTLKELDIALTVTSAESPGGGVFNAGRILGAGHMVCGSIHPEEDGIRVTVRVFDSATTLIAASATRTGSVNSLETLAESLSEELASQLDIKPENEQAYPIDLRPMANLYYMRGLIAYYNGSYPESIEQFVQALMGDQEFIEARFGLAKAFFKMQKHGEAYVQFQRVLAMNPHGDYAIQAREQMNVCIANLPDDEALFLASSAWESGAQ